MAIKKILILNIFILLFVNNIYSQGFNSIGSSDGVYILAVGNQGKIFYSNNGAFSFTSYIINSSINYNNVFATDSLFWIAASDGNLYKTFKNNINLILTYLYEYMCLKYNIQPWHC